MPERGMGEPGLEQWLLQLRGSSHQDLVAPFAEDAPVGQEWLKVARASGGGEQHAHPATMEPRASASQSPRKPFLRRRRSTRCTAGGAALPASDFVPLTRVGP